MPAPTVRRLVLVSLLALGVGVAAPAAAMASTSESRESAVADKKKKKKKPTVQIADSELGEILVDSKGFTLYLFDPDGTNIDVSNCTGGCESAWPHLTAKKVKAGEGVDASLLEIGAEGQVAYNGHLLYRYSGDVAAGDTTGHGVGGVWHAVGPDGNAIA
jgi:predicted lipoprotein with Yx(FWY)xxD motif